MKRGLPVNRAGFGPARQARQWLWEIAKHPPDAGLNAKQEHHAALHKADMGTFGIEWIVEFDVVERPVFREAGTFQRDTERLTNLTVGSISGEHYGRAEALRSISRDQDGIDAIAVLLERTQRSAAFRYDTKDSERVGQQRFGAGLRQDCHWKIRVSVTEFKLGQGPPILVEDDAMNWTGFM